jgi:hypothetical protein
METNGTTSESTLFEAWHRFRDLPGQVETGLKTHPWATAASIAGVSFVGGMVLGSRVARAILVAAAPAIVHRVLDGPLGDEVLRYIRGAFRSQSATSPIAS